VSAAPAGSIQQIIVNAFTPQGQAAVDWGLRIAKCESGYNPYAQNPSGASGLFQFMPSTFANTPPGRAGGSIWDPTANAQAAAWMYSQGRQGEWECN
jgi:soluble lytic murein transglycosylase-like protein